MMKSMLVIGLGRLDSILLPILLDLENDVMIIEVTKKAGRSCTLCDQLQNRGTAPTRVLRSLGIGNLDVIFVCIGTNFQSSLEITSLVKEMGGKHVVSKATRDIQAKFLPCATGG